MPAQIKHDIKLPVPRRGICRPSPAVDIARMLTHTRLAGLRFKPLPRHRIIQAFSQCMNLCQRGSGIDNHLREKLRNRAGNTRKLPIPLGVIFVAVQLV